MDRMSTEPNTQQWLDELAALTIPLAACGNSRDRHL
jgi:hypothetical protein